MKTPIDILVGAAVLGILTGSLVFFFWKLFDTINNLN